MTHVLGAGAIGEPPGARDVIGVHVRVDHVSDVHVRLGCRSHIQVDVVERIDNGAHRVTTAAEQIRRAHRRAVKKLAEDHDRTPETFAPKTPNLRAVASLVVPLKQS